MEIETKKNNVILIAFYDLNSFPISILHSALEKAGINVSTFFFKRLNPNNTMDYPTNNEIDCLIESIKKFKPILVGISVRSTHFKLAHRITENIKNKLDTLVIWGGIHPTIRPIQSIKSADIICVGEGDEAIVELVTKLLKNEKIDNIQNLWIKKGDKIIKNDLRPLIQNLDLVPFPDFSNKNKYFVENDSVFPLRILSFDKNKKGIYWIMTSRGCPFNCTYCSNNILREVYKNKGKYVRRRSVENVIKELAVAKERFKNLAFIAFEDDVFTFDIEWIKKFCNQYKNVINLPFFCYCHPKNTNEEIIRLLKDAGVVKMTMGIQTGSQEFRHKYYERYDSNEEIEKAAQILHKHNINCSYDIIMDNPLETEKDRRETFNLLLKLPRPFDLHTHTLTHFPETKLTKLLLGKGIISENDIEDQKQESYKRWTPSLDLKRNKENLFWDNLYYLIKKKYISKQIIIRLSYSNFLKKYPKSLTLLMRLMPFLIKKFPLWKKIKNVFLKK